MNPIPLDRRVDDLEKRLRRARNGALGLALLGLAAFQGASGRPPEDLRVRRLVVLDEEGRARIVLGEDPKGAQRISRAVGLTLLDPGGAERGGFSVLDDGSAVFGLDAPKGVGSPMRDRIGLKVHPDGTATVDLIDNGTLLPVRLLSEAGGGGGLEFFDYDLPRRKVRVKRIDFRGENVREVSLDAPK